MSNNYGAKDMVALLETLKNAMSAFAAREEKINADFRGRALVETRAFDSARENRPDLKRLAKLTDASEQSITTARAGAYPNVAAVGGYQLFKGPTNSFGDSFDGGFIGLQSQWAIFDGRATRGRVRRRGR